jgi:hypothetical protein
MAFEVIRKELKFSSHGTKELGSDAREYSVNIHQVTGIVREGLSTQWESEIPCHS